MTPQSLQMFNYAQTLPVFTFAIVYWQICFIAKLFCFFRNEGKKIVFVLKRSWTSKMSQMNDSGCRGFSWCWMNLQQIFHHDYCYVATLFDFSPLQNRCALRYNFTVTGDHIVDEDTCCRNSSHFSLAFWLASPQISSYIEIVCFC